MTQNTGNSIAGINELVPVYDPDRGFKIWALKEVYTGKSAGGVFVPNIGDRVIDQSDETWYRVTDFDITTMLVTMKKVERDIVGGVFSDDDLLLGPGPGTPSDTFRLYVNDKVLPHNAVVDQRCFIRGNRSRYAKLFRGTVLNSNQRVISAVYDNAGNLLGQDIPLELAEFVGNVTKKTVPAFKITEKIPDDEIVTMVFYNDTNDVVSKRQLVAENTNFIAGPNTGAKYITDITLDTPFLSSADSTLLQYPINVLMQGLNLMGVVHYSDGTERRMPVDGTKFAIFGLEDYVLTVVGQELDLVLNYNLSADEIAYGTTVGATRNMTKNYRAKTLVANGSYSVKLFAFPVWMDEANGYRLEWFLTNLERTNVWRCTSAVKMNENTPVFEPMVYGTNQRLSVRVNLKDINGSFNNYIHTQTVDVMLLRGGMERDTNWQIGFVPNQNPPFGIDNYAETEFVDTNIWKVRLGMGLTNLEDWLDRLFYRTLPLYDTRKESRAPAPSHFALEFTNRSIEFPIDEWKTEHIVNETLRDSGTLFIRFFKRTADNDIQLSMSAVPIYQSN